jgi:hypothetical protein
MTSHSGGSVHTQSCGRILRKDHGDITPTIWDIVDDFSSYKNQAKKRMEYYKKQNYDIFKVCINDHDDIPIIDLLNSLDKMECASVRKERKKLEKPKMEQVECLIQEDDEY